MQAPPELPINAQLGQSRSIHLGFVLFFFICVWGCGQELRIPSTDPNLSIRKGVLYYQGRVFNGILVSKIPSGRITRLVPYQDGRKEGQALTRHDNGQLLDKEFYANGKKDGIHQGWYSNGKYRYYKTYSNGKLVGEAWEWHPNGKVFTFDKYDKNGRLIAAKKWRISGQIYYNIIMRNHKQVGLGGSSLCDPAKKNRATRQDAFEAQKTAPK